MIASKKRDKTVLLGGTVFMKPDYTREIPEEIRQKMIHIGTYQPDDARMRAELDA